MVEADHNKITFSTWFASCTGATAAMCEPVPRSCTGEANGA